MSPDYATVDQFARLEERIDKLGGQILDLANALHRFDPLLLSASGYKAEIEQIRRDVDSSHVKHRTHFEKASGLNQALQDSRQDLKAEMAALDERARLAREETRLALTERLARIEARQVRLGGIFLGVFAVLQIVAPSMSDMLGTLFKALGVGP